MKKLFALSLCMLMITMLFAGCASKFDEDMDIKIYLPGEVEPSEISEENKRKTLEKKAREFRANMHAQEAEMKKAYPDFDLGKEMKNPKMQSLLASGVSLEDAYHAIHHKELLQKTAEEAKNATVSSIAAKGTRVSEGASSATVPATTKTDFSKMSRAEFMKIFNQR